VTGIVLSSQLNRNVLRFPGGLVFRLIDFVYHSTPVLKVTKKKKKFSERFPKMVAMV
jgi:hypothetical protein